jgi:hypothetical protein
MRSSAPIIMGMMRAIAQQATAQATSPGRVTTHYACMCFFPTSTTQPTPARMSMTFHSVGRIGTPLDVIVQWDMMPLPEPRLQLQASPKPTLAAQAAKRGLQVLRADAQGGVQRVDTLEPDDSLSNEVQGGAEAPRRAGSPSSAGSGGGPMHPAAAMNTQPNLAWDRRKAMRVQAVLTPQQLQAVITAHHPLPPGLYLAPAGLPTSSGDDTPASHGPVVATGTLQQKQAEHTRRCNRHTLGTGMAEVLSTMQSAEVSGPVPGDPEYTLMASDDVAPLGESAEFWAQAKRRRLVQVNFAASIHERARAHKQFLVH